ncbi:hypothetical protein Taro_026528 [Colocasia esculenta]|uniref:Transcription repressor n=1 Tax=Colocasia esculenta TaxID=4460 RepID=A0A843VD72_COLES|nr:hypothetical protein [Colocasia esculenta]
MSKRFRLRISRVIPSFHSCRCKDDATAAPACPVILPAVSRLEPPPGYLWEGDAQWHVVARVDPSPRRKIDTDDGGGELFPPLRLQRRPRRSANKKTMMRKARSRPPGGAGRASTTSSADTRWFTSEEEDEEEEEEYEEDYDYEEMEARSLSAGYSSSAASEFNPSLRTIRESPGHQPYLAAAEGRRSSSASSLLRRFLQMGPPCVGAAEGKVAESFAVVKRSEDPYLDFRRSMVEMVVEKGMYEEGDLEELLQCLLSLNSRRHHAAIARAFSDICAALFDPSSRSSCVSAAATPPPPAFTPA